MEIIQEPGMGWLNVGWICFWFYNSLERYHMQKKGLLTWGRIVI